MEKTQCPQYPTELMCKEWHKGYNNEGENLGPIWMLGRIAELNDRVKEL